MTNEEMIDKVLNWVKKWTWPNNIEITVDVDVRDINDLEIGTVVVKRHNGIWSAKWRIGLYQVAQFRLPIN